MTTALTLTNGNPINLGALIEAQGESLAAKVDQATKIFKENQAKQKETIDALAISNDQLKAALVKKQNEFDELIRTHEAALKALKDQHAQLAKCLTDEIVKTQDICRKIVSLQDQNEVCCCFTHVKKHHQPPPTNYAIPYSTHAELFAHMLLQLENDCMGLYKGKESGALRELTKTQVAYIQTRLEIFKKELQK